MVIIWYLIQVQLWAEKGLINFSLTSPINAIPLCPLCYTQFDLANDPGFVFFPNDLEILSLPIDNIDLKQQGKEQIYPDRCQQRNSIKAIRCKRESFLQVKLAVFISEYS